MKRQWSLILALAFALIVAIFAVINVEVVEVDYLFGTTEWPLVLIILGSVVMGAFIIGAAGMFKYLSLIREIRTVKKENEHLKNELGKENTQFNSEQKKIQPDDVGEELGRTEGSGESS
jgi:putative membrane protein